MPGSVEEWEALRLDNITLKKLSDVLATELGQARSKLRIAGKEVIELNIVVNGAQKINGDLRSSNDAMSQMINHQKDDIHELTATLTSSQLEALSKGKYIDKYMKPLKDDAQAKHHQARIAEDIIRAVKDDVIEAGPITWSRSEILHLIDTKAEEIKNDPT